MLFHKQMNVNTRVTEYIPYLLDRDPITTGEDLRDATQTYDPQSNLPEVNFELNPMGADKFEKGTAANVGNMMAIVLDNNYRPRIQAEDRRGQGED